MTEQEIKTLVEECVREQEAAHKDLTKARQSYQASMVAVKKLSLDLIAIQGRLDWLQQQKPTKEGKK